MSITFCATAKALQICLAQLSSSLVFRTLTCGSAELELLEAESGTTVLLEAGSAPLALYSSPAGSAVSMLANQGVHVIVAPSLLEQSVLAIPKLLPADAPASFHVGVLGAADRALLMAGELRLLLLQDDACVTYTPSTATLAVCGAGCAILFWKNVAAGTAPAAITVNVLVPGMSCAWPSVPTAIFAQAQA
jgi:hypothetical protein